MRYLTKSWKTFLLQKNSLVSKDLLEKTCLSFFLQSSWRITSTSKGTAKSDIMVVTVYGRVKSKMANLMDKVMFTLGKQINILKVPKSITNGKDSLSKLNQKIGKSSFLKTFT